MRIADGTRMREPGERDARSMKGAKEAEGEARGPQVPHREPVKDERREYVGGPNPPAVRSYRGNMHFSRNNPQRLEKRLIDCPAHDFACKGALERAAFFRSCARVCLHANAIPVPRQK